MKGIDALPGRGRETDMQARLQVCGHGPCAGEDPEGSRFLAIAKRGLTGADAGVTQRLQCRVVEFACLREVADANGDMVDHSWIALSAPARRKPVKAGRRSQKIYVQREIERLGKIAIFEPWH